MGFFCRCKKCGTDFVDDYGEYVKDGYLTCPNCGSTDLQTGNEITDMSTFNPQRIDDFEELKGESDSTMVSRKKKGNKNKLRRKFARASRRNRNQ